VSPAGIEPALPRDRRSIGRLHHGSRCTPGNIRDCFTPCGESLALPLSYRKAEPSGRSRTSDLAIIDAADLFATGEQDWRGTYDAVHALAGRALRLAGFEPVRRRGAFPRSNSHLHHRRVRASRADVEVAGEQSIFGGTPTDTRSAACEALAARDAPACQADSTARSIGGGIRTRFSMGAKYPKSSPPAYVVS
jgi:hypothetical protein